VSVDGDSESGRLTQYRGMQGVYEWNEKWRCDNDQEYVCKKEIRTPQRHFHNLDDELPSWLRHGRCTKPSSIPFSSPPCAIRLVMFVFTSEENRDQNLL
jgi:hypothetical protein